MYSIGQVSSRSKRDIYPGNNVIRSYPRVELAYRKKTVAIYSCMQTLMTQSDKHSLIIILACS